MSSPLVFFQIAVADPEASRAFYSEVFGWSFGAPAADGGISIAPQGPEDFDAQGLLSKFRGDGDQAVTLFFRVADLWDTIDRAEARGAEVLSPIRQVPAGAHLAVIRAPDGVVVGIIQA
jgi:predicted enzyme related to lactoylglutathione lyase